MTRQWIIEHIIDTGVVDDTDASIIEKLIEDASQSTQAIANAVNIKRTTAHGRIKKIIDKGIIS